MCPSVENPDLVFRETGDSQSLTHPRPSECDRQTIQTRSDHTDRMVPPSTGLPSNMFPIATASSGSVCHQIQQQTTTVCFTGSRPPCLGSGCTQPVLDLDPYALPPVAILGKVVEKLQDYPYSRIILIVPGWPNMPWFWACPICQICCLSHSTKPFTGICQT